MPSARSGSRSGSSVRQSFGILLAAGTLQLLNSPWSTIAGHRFLLFDLGLTIGAVGILITFVVAAVQNTRKLYAMEPLPGAIFFRLMSRTQARATAQPAWLPASAGRQ